MAIAPRNVVPPGLSSPMALSRPPWFSGAVSRQGPNSTVILRAATAASTGSSTALTSYTIANPSWNGTTTITKDVILLYVVLRGATVLSTPAGFTAIPAAVIASTQFQLFYKVTDGTEGPTFTVSWASGGNTSSAVCLSYSGVDTALVLDPAPTISAVTGLAASSITTARDGDRLVWFAGSKTSSAGQTPGSITPPLPFSQVTAGNATTTGADPNTQTIAAQSGQTTHGSTGVLTGTDSTPSIDSTTGSLVVALPPAGPPIPGNPAQPLTPPGFMSPMRLAGPVFYQFSGPASTSASVSITGVTANVNVNVQFADQGIAIYSVPSVQFPFSLIIPEPLNFNPAYRGLVPQQQNNVTITQVSGVTSGVNVTAPAGSINIYQNFNPPFPAPALLPSSLQFNPAYLTLRQQTNTALPDVFVPGSAANVNVSSQFADEIITESVIGTTANINVSAIAGSIAIYTETFQPFTFLPLLPNSLRFNSSLSILRQQSNTGTPVNLSGIVGAVANVNISGQSDNTVTETLTGTTSAVSVAAQAGTVTIYTQTFQPFTELPVLPGAIRFNSSYIALRQQYSTSLPDVFVIGVTATVNVASVSGTVSEAVSSTANVSVASSIDESVTISTSATVNLPVSAVSGSVLEVISGSTGLVNAIAVAGTVTISGGAATNVIGDFGIVRATAIPGSFEYINNTTWWRVYRGYANWPTW